MRSLSLAMMSLATVLSLAACGASKTIKPADQAAIDSVSVAPSVKVTVEPMLVGSESGLTMLFGAVGAAVAAAGAEKDGVKNLVEFMSASGIDAGEIARQQFTEKLKGHPFYGSRLSTEGGYRFVLEVPSYGINKVNAFSSYWMAIMRINYQLLSPDGKVLAEDWAVSSVFTDRPEFTMEELKADPQKLRQALEFAASEASTKLMKK
jgi:hypothetical protein